MRGYSLRSNPQFAWALTTEHKCRHTHVTLRWNYLTEVSEAASWLVRHDIFQLFTPLSRGTFPYRICPCQLNMEHLQTWNTYIWACIDNLTWKFHSKSFLLLFLSHVRLSRKSSKSVHLQPFRRVELARSGNAGMAVNIKAENVE